MYFQAKFGSKRINSSEDTVETVIFDHVSLCCDLDLEDSKSIILHGISAHVDASPYQIWLQNVWRLEDIIWTNIY